MNLSFQTKLLLSMMLVVVGVTITTLLITANEVRKAYRAVFEEQFTSALNLAAAEQEDRLERAQLFSHRLATNPAVVLALVRTNTAALYANVVDEIIGEFREDRPERKGRQTNRVRGALRRAATTTESGEPDRLALAQQVRKANIMLRFLDAGGTVMATDEPLLGRANLKSRTLIEQMIRPLIDGAQEIRSQDVAYVTVSGETNSIVYEVIVTPVFVESEKRFAGAILFGSALDFGEQSLFERMKGVRSGMLIDGQVYSGTVPTALAPALAVIARSPVSNHEVSLEPESFQVIARPLNPESHFPKAYQIGLFPQGEVQIQVATMRWKVLGSAAVALTGGLALSLLLTHGLSVPIRALVAGTRAVKEGDFTVKLPVHSRDEIGALTESFNGMTAGLAERERFRTVLDLVADKKVAEALMRGEGANLGGELREVTVLFCDIRGFTRMTSGMPPQDVIALLNEHMTALTRVVYECDGVVDKFVGDLIMAVFGAPTVHANDVSNAARCALQMMEARAELSRNSGRTIEMGIGLATGEVIAGCMGSSDRVDYTVLGERVNLASRLCSAAGPMEVLIDDATAKSLGSSAVLENRPPITPKGFSDPVQIARLVDLQG
jgi:class 3 adenylate cyclase